MDRRRALLNNVEMVLVQAAALVERGWCQKAAARSAGDQACDIADDEAVAWSAVGAIERAAIDQYSASWSSAMDGVDEALRAVASILTESRTKQTTGRWDEFDGFIELVFDWNDAEGRTAGEVAETLRRATTGRVAAIR
jgi:hypothetical protein